MTTPKALPPEYEHDALTSRLRTLALVGLSNADAVTYGRNTYTDCLAYVRCESKHSGRTVQAVADLHGAASTNTPPKREVALVTRWLSGDIGGHTGSVISKVRAILDGATLRSVTGADALKTVSYSEAIAGNLASVVVDRWIHRAGTGNMSVSVPSGDAYRAIARALVEVADSFGWAPANMQALIWYVINPRPDMGTPQPCDDCKGYGA